MPLPLSPQPPPALSVSKAWLLASDPAGLRARRGAQAALAAVLTGCVIALISSLAGLPARSMAAGVMVAIFGVVMVRERGRAQHLTTAALFAASALTAALAAALLPWWRLQALAFLAVIFLAVYARRFGSRWAAVGMAAYVSYLLICYLRTPLAQLPDQWLGIAIGAAVADVSCAGLLRERPGRTLAGAARAMDLQVGLLLAEVEAAGRGGGWTRRRRRRLARSQNLLVQDIALIEHQLQALGAEADPDAWALRRRLLRLEHAASALARLALQRPPTWPAEREAVAAVKRTGFRARRAAPAARTAPGCGGLAAAAARLAAVGPATPLAAAVGAAHNPPSSADASDAVAQPGPGRRALDPALRQAIQSTAACGLAMLGGLALSPQRWLWAVISAYVMFAGVKSSGHVLVKALQRMFGTLAGVLFGIVLATLVSGHPAAAVPLLAILVFLTFYSFQASYTAMIFWLTLALALVYGLLGYFKPELLLLRLEETGVGSAAGALVALTLFRTHTHEAVWEASVSFLKALRALVCAAAEAAPGQARLQRMRDLALAFEAVRDATRPNAGAMGPPMGAQSLPILQALSDCRYFADELALGEEAPAAASSLPPADLQPIIAQIDRIESKFETGGRLAAARPKRKTAEPPAAGLQEALEALDRLAPAGSADQRGGAAA